ncbi:hypothetical protein M409DRAFT_50115 [Zasmidium cellare ATCC 36951]|uniref:Uncharacterized protein n=1 Tax=Zasmidium cellare ATCC 36951 TaxID=1080233 RepID=A0A6A6D073_ZASCE|nr:uncharacterized protein M409DRAFT_50115 [Zasmidium cellare ATCC 36951]KAF2172413.1 hypothetical protein M409DRAFT_50115 [Zasmidium cellare ATCC 36951]
MSTQPPLTNSQQQWADIDALVKSKRSAFASKEALKEKIANMQLTSERLTQALNLANTLVDEAVSKEIDSYYLKIENLRTFLRSNSEAMARMRQDSIELRKGHLADKITLRWDVTEYTENLVGKGPLGLAIRRQGV